MFIFGGHKDIIPFYPVLLRSSIPPNSACLTCSTNIDNPYIIIITYILINSPTIHRLINAASNEIMHIKPYREPPPITILFC